MEKEVCRACGFTLVIVLFLLALVLIFVVAFAANMRTERKAAYNMSQGQRADLMTEGALAHSISLLASNIPDPGDPTIETPAGTARNWLINPGRLTLIDSSSSPNITHIPLHSGEASTRDPNTAVNLNAPVASTGEFPITGADDPMWVSWINVLQNASEAPSQSNQLTGRYAFWIDDECAKINFNTARGKPPSMVSETSVPANWTSSIKRDLHSHLTPSFTVGTTTYTLGQPASINLNSLGVDVTELDADIKANGFCVQPDAIKNYATGDPEDFFRQNKFHLTPFSRSPEFNVFGKSRLFMQYASSDLAKSPVYQHCMHPEQPVRFFGYHAGLGSNTGADAAEMRQLREPIVRSVAKYLQRTDWPGMSNTAFRWTTSPKSLIETDQIALNISSMGYWATTEIADSGTDSLAAAMYRYEKITGAYGAGTTTPNANFWKGALTGKPMIAPAPAPQITEVACTIIPEPRTATAYRIKCVLSVELYQPPGNYSTPDNPATTPDEDGYYTDSTNNQQKMDVAVTDYSISVTTASGTRENSCVFGEMGADFDRLIPSVVPRDGYIGRDFQTLYVTASPRRLPHKTDNPAAFTGAATVRVKARINFNSHLGGRPIQTIPIHVPSNVSVPGEFRPPSGNADDAFLVFEFTIPASPSATPYVQSYEISDPRLSADRANWKLFPPAGGDSDSLGFENSNSELASPGALEWAMWNFNTPDNDRYPGTLTESSGATSFRGSSIGMYSMIPTGMQRGIPMETLHFNGGSPPGQLPDWVILDLLAPTFPYPISFRNSTAGKINLNSKIYPANANFSPPPRTAPLEALFMHMPHGAEAASAIQVHQDSGGYFDYIGRICELPDVADLTQGTTEYEQEVLIRHLASLVTTQSNTFSVWGVAQTVKKVPGNTNYGSFENRDIVTGERRFHAVVERGVWTGKEGIPGNARVVNGEYTKASPDNDRNRVAPPGPGLPPHGQSTTKVWAEIDGPHDPNNPVVAGPVPFTQGPLDTADNPLAAAMKYRVIFWEYLD